MSAAATPADVLAGTARWCVVEGDCNDALRSLPDGAVDAVVSDPPSGIAFMGAEWDHNKGGRLQWAAWLAGILADARRATRDGGRALVWSLPRTSHWTGCAVEDAGWSIETTIAHLFGTGWPKGKAQTKPAQETWWLARTGRSEALNIEACRVGSGADRSSGGAQGTMPGPMSWGEKTGHPRPVGGRYPPNLVLSHAAGCVCEGTRRVRSDSTNASRGPGGYGGRLAAMPGNTGHADPNGTELVEAWMCVEGCPVAELGRQSGETRSSGHTRQSGARSFGGRLAAGPTRGVVDEGTASRYFPQFPADDPDAPWSEALFQYIAKPSRAERNAGCDGLSEAPSKPYNGGAGMPGRSLVDGEWTNTTTPRAASANHHPTVKPVALMRWLIRLITKPGDVVLDPFGGSGTTGVAALLEGRRVILIEREPAFTAIARARCAAAEASTAPQPPEQLSLLARSA